jgi:hypothetical protein
MTDEVAERVRKIGGTTVRSIGHICRLQRLIDNDAAFVTPQDMLSELHEDEKKLVQIMRALHTLCAEAEDFATQAFLKIGSTNRSDGAGFSSSRQDTRRIWITRRTFMSSFDLAGIVQTLFAGDLGLMAMDESTEICNKRLPKLG